MANSAKIGMGTTVSIGGVNIPGLEKVPPFARSKPKIDSTNFGSGGKQYIQGLEEITDIQYSAQHDPTDAGQMAVKAAYLSGAETTFVHVYPFTAARTITYTGKVVSYEETSEIDNKMMLNWTVAITVSSIAYS
jgi:hypothetical protein